MNGVQRAPAIVFPRWSRRAAASAILVGIVLGSLSPATAAAAALPASPYDPDDVTGTPSALVAPPVVDPIVAPSRSISVGAGHVGVTISKSNTVLDGYTITGPQATRYDAREIGILVAGTAAHPLHNVTIRNCTISRFGYGGIVLRYVTSFRIENCHIHDAVYAGIMVISSKTGTIRNNVVQRIGVVGYQTREMNSYGIAITDEGGPVSYGITISSNKVEDVPQWHGIDTHGGRRITITSNTIRRTNRAIFITSTTQGRRAAFVIINRNSMSQPTRRVDVYSRYPYNQIGITLYNADRVTGTGNIFDGWPRGQHISVSGSRWVSIVSSRVLHPR